MQSKRNSINDLAKACAVSADAAEWGEFLRLCTPLASMVAIRASRLWGNGASSVADDIVQEIFLKLCEQERRILREFEPRVRIPSWACCVPSPRRLPTIISGDCARPNEAAMR